MRLVFTIILFYLAGILHASGFPWGGIFFIILGCLVNKMEFKRQLEEYE